MVFFLLVHVFACAPLFSIIFLFMQTSDQPNFLQALQDFEVPCVFCVSGTGARNMFMAVGWTTCPTGMSQLFYGKDAFESTVRAKSSRQNQITIVRC